MVERVRQLDPQAVETAEYLRKYNRVALAAEIAAFALGSTTNPLTPEEIAQIAKDPIQRAILACLARIHVDSLKTLANQSVNPRVVVSSIHIATGTIRSIYHDPSFQIALKDVNVDYRGGQHYFLAEMSRDEAKTCFAAADIFPKEAGLGLILTGEKILRETYKQLPENHPTKPLIGIELALSILARGKFVDIDEVINNFTTLVKLDEKSNPHRVATVASWMIVWGGRTDNFDMLEDGSKVYNRLIKDHPELLLTKGEEKKDRQKILNLRRAILRLTTPLMVDQRRKRQEMFVTLSLLR